jgi:hypothetical protein
MQLINLMCLNEDDGEVYLQQFITDPRDTVEEDLRSAIDDFLRTGEGAARVLENECFTWNNVRECIPDSHWKEYGFEPLLPGMTLTLTDIHDVDVDENEDLAETLLPQLQAQMEAARAETDAKAIRSEEALVQRLKAAWYTEEQSRTAAGLLSGRIDPESVPGVSTFIQECYNRPSDDEILRHALNDVLEMHGIEYARTVGISEDSDPDITYLETGDTYNLTLVEFEGDWYCTSLGDVLESVDSRIAIPGKVALTEPEHDPLASAGSGDQPTLG